MSEILTEIDQALARSDLKRAETLIARQIRRTNDPVERAELLFRRAQSRLMDAKPEDAMEDLQTALALQPQRGHDADIGVLIGDTHFARYELAPVGFSDREDTNTALQHYEAVIEAHPDFSRLAWIFYQCGRIKLSQNDMEAAARYFQRALEAPNHTPDVRAMAQERLGFVALFEKRDPAAALEHFRAAQKVATGEEPPGWLVQLNIRMSHAHLERQEYEDALAAARSALRTIQSNSTGAHRVALPEAHLAIADVMAVMQGYESEAIEHYLRFLQYSKRPPGIDVTWSKVHETIGHLAFRLERYQQAITAFEKALEINPYHPWDLSLRYQIARCYYRSRMYERVVETIAEIEEGAEDDEVRDWRVYNLQGNAFFALEDFQAASEAYQTAIDLAPAGENGVEKARIYLRFCEELMQSAEE